MNSTLSADFTYSFDKYSCIKEMYFVHIFLAYFTSLMGVACFSTRLSVKAKWLHKWFGKFYIIGMLLCTASALLINNDGLPLGVLYSFIWVLLGLSFGWILISFHQTWLSTEALNYLESKISQGTLTDFPTEFEKAKGEILANKTIIRRVISYKGTHGAVMFLSWINITGRIFASTGSILRTEFSCFTYPAIKPIDTIHYQAAGKPLELVPIRNENYSRLPWANNEVGWFLYMFFGPMIFAFAVGFGYVFLTSRKSKGRVNQV